MYVCVGPPPGPAHVEVFAGHLRVQLGSCWIPGLDAATHAACASAGLLFNFNMQTLIALMTFHSSHVLKGGVYGAFKAAPYHSCMSI